MKIGDIIQALESLAPPSLQEGYDNAGLIAGNENNECTGILVSLDATEEVIKEAIRKNCNLVVSHHPIVFSGLKKISGKNYVGRSLITAIKNDIAIYAIHTNLDNVLSGVNGRIAEIIDLKNCRTLAAKEKLFKKLYTFVPVADADKVRHAIFDAGAGHIGNYSECSFNTEGTGTFKAGVNTNPFVGKQDEQHHEKELKIEVIFPAWLEAKILKSLFQSHPYEEVAFDIISVENRFDSIGSGIVGELDEPIEEMAFLRLLKEKFGLQVLKHTSLLNKPVKRVALCGGAGSLLISSALRANADFYITSDLKYHEYFDANDNLVLVDIGHYESEQFTINLLQEFLEQKFPTFAVLKTEVNTNPVNYFL